MENLVPALVTILPFVSVCFLYFTDKYFEYKKYKIQKKDDKNV